MRNMQGFTLIEMMIVLTIVGVMASVVTPLFQAIQDNIKRKEEVVRVQGYVEALKSYYFQQLNNRISRNAISIQQGLTPTAADDLLPVAVGADPILDGLNAAQDMIDQSLVGTTQRAEVLASATSNLSRKIALYVQQPDMTAATNGYANFIQSQGPNLTAPAPLWGSAYCPSQALSFYGANNTIAGANNTMAMALVISAGPNGIYDTFGGAATPPPEPTVPDWRDPAFQVLGDDQGYVINFTAYHSALKKDSGTQAKLSRIAISAASYFRQQYTQDAFVNGSSIDVIMGTRMPVYFAPISTPNGMRTNLSLPASEMLDDFGNPFYVRQLTTVFPYTLGVFSLCGDFAAIPASAP